MLELARQSGLIVVRENETEPATLSYSLLARGIPALTLEMGESYVVNESNIRIGLNCVWNLLAALGMTEPQPDGPYRYSLAESDGGRVYEYSDQPVCSTSGIIRFMTKPDAVVERGQIVARVYNAFGKPQETLHARSRGIVLGHADSPVVFPGMPVIAFASLNVKRGVREARFTKLCHAVAWRLASGMVYCSGLARRPAMTIRSAALLSIASSSSA